MNILLNKNRFWEMLCETSGGKRMDLQLVKMSEKFKPQLLDMMDEWTKTGENIIPWAIRKVDYHDFDAYLKSLEESEPKEGYVPASTFFAYDRERDILVGAVDIRHSLNEALLLDGGHIGDGVRPSERRKGYATAMIALALDECRKLGIEKVLMVCNKENTGSAKSIQNNGGVLENERRYRCRPGCQQHSCVHEADVR